jgi:hypothetical protein
MRIFVSTGVRLWIEQPVVCGAHDDGAVEFLEAGQYFAGLGAECGDITEADNTADIPFGDSCQGGIKGE